MASVLRNRQSPSSGRKGHLTTLGGGGSRPPLLAFPWSLEQAPNLERGASVAQRASAPATSTRPFGFLGRSHPRKAFPGGLRMSPGVYGCPETGRASLEQRDREQSGQKTPFYLFLRLLPSCHAPPSIARPPAPSKTQKNNPSCRLLPPPPPYPQETFKCIRHIDCIKHDEFLRHELAGLPWLPLP